jgi:hypothetical protein
LRFAGLLLGKGKGRLQVVAAFRRVVGRFWRKKCGKLSGADSRSYCNRTHSACRQVYTLFDAVAKAIFKP